MEAENMNKKEDLIKIIEKALNNHWKVLGDENCLELCIWSVNEDLDFVVREREYPDEGVSEYSVNDVIFSHDFARAFFGENENVCSAHGYQIDVDDFGNAFCEKCCVSNCTYECERAELIPDWQYQLTQLARTPIEYRINYLMKFI